MFIGVIGIGIGIVIVIRAARPNAMNVVVGVGEVDLVQQRPVHAGFALGLQIRATNRGLLAGCVLNVAGHELCGCPDPGPGPICTLLLGRRFCRAEVGARHVGCGLVVLWLRLWVLFFGFSRTKL